MAECVCGGDVKLMTCAEGEAVVCGEGEILGQGQAKVNKQTSLG